MSNGDDNGVDVNVALQDLQGIVDSLMHIFGSMQEISWGSLGSVLWDGDVIDYSDDDAHADQVTITLNAGAGITWWKDIEVYDKTGALRAAAWTQDSHTSSSLAVPNEVAQESILVFKKGKFLNAHTAAYLIRDLITKQGHNITLTWIRDN